MTKGGASPVPEYWTIIQAAKYLNVSPWELAERPYYWVLAAIACMEAEQKLHEKEQKRAQAKRKK